LNGFDFAAAMVGHLFSWPTAVVLSVLLLRKSLADLIPRLQTLEAFGGKADFGERLARAEAQASEALELEADSGGGGAAREQSDSSDGDERLHVGRFNGEAGPAAQAASNPSYAVVAAWEDVASATMDLANAAKPGRASKVFNIGRAIGELRQDGVISAQIAELFRELHQLRNDVAHGRYSPTPGEALAYVVTTNNLLDEIDVIADGVAS
jgi:hypothetical protein